MKALAIKASEALMVGALVAGQAFAAGSAPGSPPSPDAAELSEGLIYSVDRTPERPFDTARDCEVITQEEIAHANVRELGQLLERRLGIGVVRGESGSMPIVRGLGGKQVLFLVDGVKVNNATWRGASKEYLALFDLSQIERIEIVRGVVSVLGTDSLGGVVNIITKKGAGAKPGSVSGSVAGRYASAEHSLGSTVTAAAAVGALRIDAGISRTRAGDTTGGGGIGSQAGTELDQDSGHLNGQWLLAPDKTVELSLQSAKAREETPGNGTSIVSGQFDPSQLTLLSVAYQDLVGRGWEDSLRLTVYSNHQREIRDVLLLRPVLRTQHEADSDQLYGFNLELGSFLGAHHLVYGLDYTDESVDSSKPSTIVSTGVTTPGRGNEMDGASYRTASAYLQDRADLGRWLTVIAGARLAQFEASGHEIDNLGDINIDTKRANVTGALNLIGHVTPHVNLIGNVISGYRAPNLDDLGGSATKPGLFWIPNPEAKPEKVVSLEAGLKYESAGLQGSLTYFDNRFIDYLVFAPTTFGGLPFADLNGNGRQDPGEFPVVHLANVGKASIHGVEGRVVYDLLSGLSVYADYSRLIGTDDVVDGPLTMMPPASGGAGLRYASPAPRSPWAEVDYRLSQAQHRLSPADIANSFIGPNGVPGYQVLDLRGGLTVVDHLSLSLALENVLDKQYRFMGSNRYQPGRQLVVGVTFGF